MCDETDLSERGLPLLCLVRDEDRHWYVIPADRKDEWYEYCDKVARFWSDYSEDKINDPPPDQPGWAADIHSGPESVLFLEYCLRP